MGCAVATYEDRIKFPELRHHDKLGIPLQINLSGEEDYSVLTVSFRRCP